jgi:hypothetical protein
MHMIKAHARAPRSSSKPPSLQLRDAARHLVKTPRLGAGVPKSRVTVPTGRKNRKVIGQTEIRRFAPNT